MGLQKLTYLDQNQDSRESILTCKRCHTHLLKSTSVVSKNFTAASGAAYLVTDFHNLTPSGDPADKIMRTGLHNVVDVKCVKCNDVLGWQYLKAYEYSERYKEGKCVLELSKLSETYPVAAVQPLDQENIPQHVLRGMR